MSEASRLNRFRRLLGMILALGALLLALPLRAQDTNLAASLVPGGPAVAGETVTLALHFSPRTKEWHGYWSNPGDAGLGLALEWDLPDGWSAGKPVYPVPQRLLISGLMNHVYKGDHAVLVPISVPQGFSASGKVPVSVKAQWLACTDKICVPERATLTSFIPTDADARIDPRFGTWRASIAPPLNRTGTFERVGGNLRIAIPMPASMKLADPHLFVENERLIDYAAAQTFRRLGDTLTVEIPLKGNAQPERVEGILALGSGNGVAIAAEPGEVPQGGKLITGHARGAPPLFVLILGALAGGLILNVMPCVFPVLSLKAISLARAGESASQARREGLAYTVGVVLATMSLGGLMLGLRAAGEQVGWAFQLQEPGVVVFLLVLATAITANLAGLFELPSLSFTRSGEPASAFATGLLAAFVATPCTGPFMAAALGAALLLPTALALALFAALGLGLALPFLLIGMVPALRARLPRPGPWMDRFRMAMAIPMGLTALALVWLVKQLGGEWFAVVSLVVVLGMLLALAVVGRLQRVGRAAWPAFAMILAPFAVFAVLVLPSSYAEQASDTSESILEPQVFSVDALASARASGKPVFVWFTADWCVTCKVNEQVAMEREATRAAFEKAGVITMVGDWTRRDEAITDFLTEHGAAGVPFYLWYDPGKEGEVLPQVLTADMLIQRAERLRSGTGG